MRLGALRKLAPTVASYFDDPRLQQVFSFQSMYAGLSPFEALAIYCVITYMDTVEGVFFPEGGIHTIACGLAAAAGRAGAQFVYGDPVERILCAPGGGIAGVRLESGARVDAAVVVSNADVVATYAELLERPAPRVARRGRYSPSCALWHRRRAGRTAPSVAPITTCTSAPTGAVRSTHCCATASACPTRRSW